MASILAELLAAILNTLITLAIPFITIFVIGYGFAWVMGGKAYATKYAKWVKKKTSNLIGRMFGAFGRRMGVIANAYPKTMGIIIFVVVAAIIASINIEV